MSRFPLVLLLALCLSGAFSHRVIGPPSGGEDDATSVAECPGWEFVFTCDCDNESHCDGGKISSDARTCTVYNEHGKGGVSAVADCRLPITILHSGEDWQNNPTLECETGYSVQSCRYYTNWKQNYVSATAVISGNGCAVQNCERCQVFAVCLYNGYVSF